MRQPYSNNLGIVSTTNDSNDLAGIGSSIWSIVKAIGSGTKWVGQNILPTFVTNVLPIAMQGYVTLEGQKITLEALKMQQATLTTQAQTSVEAAKELEKVNSAENDFYLKLAAFGGLGILGIYGIYKMTKK